MQEQSLEHSEEVVCKWISQLTEGKNPFALLSEKQENELHTFAFALYQSRHYLDASHCFRLLILAAPKNAKYWKALGACMQMRKEYDQALNCYISAQLLGAADAYLDIYIADCYFALKQVKEALRALNLAQVKAQAVHDERVLKHVSFMKELWSNLK